MLFGRVLDTDPPFRSKNGVLVNPSVLNDATLSVDLDCLPAPEASFASQLTRLSDKHSYQRSLSFS